MTNPLKVGDRVKLINPASAIAHCVPIGEAVLGRKGTVKAATAYDVLVVFDSLTNRRKSGWYFAPEELSYLTAEESKDD